MGEIAVVFGVCLISEGISFLLPFPFPAGVISLVLLLLLLFSVVVKERHIGRVSGFLVDNMAFFFVPPCVAIIEHWEKLLPYLIPFFFIAVVTTPLVYLVTAWPIQLLIRRKGGKGRGETFFSPPPSLALC